MDKRTIIEFALNALTILEEYLVSDEWGDDEIDEGVVGENEQIGEYGPYKQSQRKEIYDTFAKYMIENDMAYPCFCNEDELKELKDFQMKKKMRKEENKWKNGKSVR